MAHTFGSWSVDSGRFENFDGMVAGLWVHAARAPYPDLDGLRLWRASVQIDGGSVSGSGRCAVAAVRAAFAVALQLGAVPSPSGGGAAPTAESDWLDALPTPEELQADWERREPMCDVLGIADPLWFDNIFEGERMFKGTLTLAGHPYRVEVTHSEKTNRFMAVIASGAEIAFAIRAMGESPTAAIAEAVRKFNRQ